MTRSEGGLRRRLVHAGTIAWSVLGIVGVLVVGYLMLSELSAVVVPLVLALFVAGALEPVVRLLARWHLPRPLGALLALVLTVAALGGLIALIVPRFAAQMPELLSSVQRAAGRLDEFLTGLPGLDIDLASAARAVAAQLFGTTGGGGPVATATALLGTTLSLLAGLALLAVVAFFYLSQGRWLVTRLIGWLPRPRRADATAVAERVWEAVGGYIRGILLVATFDALGVGIGLVLLRVPLALPLAVLVFLGAFLPYFGAFASGLLAVLVALAERGVGIALAVLGVIVVVQQLEGYVLQPLLMGRAIRLPAFVILLSILIGFAGFGVIGAFLAVPVAASATRAVSYWTDEPEPSAGAQPE